MTEVYYYRVVKNPPRTARAKNNGKAAPVADLEARIERLAERAKAHAPLSTEADRDGAAERGERVRE